MNNEINLAASPQETSTPWYKKWWVWLIIVITFFTPLWWAAFIVAPSYYLGCRLGVKKGLWDKRNGNKAWLAIGTCLLLVLVPIILAVIFASIEGLAKSARSGTYFGDPQVQMSRAELAAVIDGATKKMYIIGYVCSILVCASMGIHAFLANKAKRVEWMAIFLAPAIFFMPFIYIEIISKEELGQKAGINFPLLWGIHLASIAMLLISLFHFQLPAPSPKGNEPMASGGQKNGSG